MLAATQLAAILLVTTTGRAQVAEPGPQPHGRPIAERAAERAADPQQEPQRFNVLFTSASSSRLDAFRRAIRRRAPAAEVAGIVAGLEATARRNHAPFAQRIAALGGEVLTHWWIVDGCCVRLSPEHLAAVRAWVGVARVEADAARWPQLEDATNAAHHNSDAANAWKDRNGLRIIGSGVTIGILDTGIDALSGSSNRPHRCFFPGGNPANNQNPGLAGSLLLDAVNVPGTPGPDDTIGHGTAVAGCAAANQWNAQAGVDDGIAPGAGIVSCNIANSLGLSFDSWIVSGWQMLAARRAQHGIVAANHSFTGSPDLANVAQQALDSLAYNADILVTVSAGNLGTNTTASQHAFNGLAVGSVDKSFLSTSSFSAVGPLNGSARTYPDLVAVGNAIITVEHDLESSHRFVSGTSYAAPMVAGVASLVRQAAPTLSALETKAILLDSTRFRSPIRNLYGLGFLQADAATQAALDGDVVRGAVIDTRRTALFPFQVTAPGTGTVTVAWMRSNTSSPTPPDLDLRIFNANNQLVAQDRNPENSYEHVRFAATVGSYRAEVHWTNPPPSAAIVEFAIIGVANRNPPAISLLSPAAVHRFAPPAVTIQGSGLATATAVHVGTQVVTEFTVLDDGTLRFHPPNLMALGSHPVWVVNPAGASPKLPLAFTGRTPPFLDGAVLATAGGGNERYTIHSQPGWLSLLCVSDSPLPSRYGGIFDLGIGNNFQTLYPLIYLHQGPDGSASLSFAYPASFPKIPLHFQAMSVDTQAVLLPYPASNVLTVLVR